MAEAERALAQRIAARWFERCQDGAVLSRDELVEMIEDELTPAISRLRDWIVDLHSGIYINCVYCGHRYGPKETTPVSMADALKLHIAQCPEHPMSELLKAGDKLVAHLDARIDAAPSNAKPVFHGLVEMITALARARCQI
jgi:hypothetical protein